MARLAAQAKLLYYPTDLDLVEKLATWFTVDGPTRIVDPCCGKGDALERFASHFDPKPMTWGIELSYSRAQEAEKKLDRVLPANFYQVHQPSRWEPRSVGLIFNNPPYDWSEFEEVIVGGKRRVRHEILFIESCTTKIVPGGHQIVIIGRGMLGDASMTASGNENRIARHLAAWYEEVHVYHQDTQDWKRFNQIVILALKKRSQYEAPTKDKIEAITQYHSRDVEIPALPEGIGAYIIPPGPETVKFIYKPVQPEELVRIGKKCSPIGTPEFYRATYVRPLGAVFEPATPLKLGHMTMMISGQETGVITLNDKQGNKMLVKGRTRKVAEVTSEDHENERGYYSSTSVQSKEKHVTVLSIVHDDGKAESLREAAEVGKFITQYSGEIADAILAKNKPLYDFVAEQWEMDTLEPIAKGLPPLPGRDEVGLFETQKHFAIATYRVLKKHKAAIINAEMGFGKTSTAVGTITLLDEWPGVVWCPDHMTHKWKRDVVMASDPDKRIEARIITRPTLNSYPVDSPTDEEIKANHLWPWGSGYIANIPQWLWLEKEIHDAGGIIVSTARYQIDPVSVNDSGQRRKIIIHFETSTAQEAIKAILYRQTFKDKEHTIMPKIKFDGKRIVAEFYDRDDYTLSDFITDYQLGILGRRAVAICAFDPVKYDAGWETEPATNVYVRKLLDKEVRYREQWYTAHVHVCSSCGETVSIDEVPTTKHPRCEKCNGALFNFKRWRRRGLARAIQQHYKHFFKFCIADEVHKTKSGDTDIGVADQRLLSSIKYNIALTGTLFGGTAGSLFYLLYRRSPEVRRLYAQDDYVRWVDHFGLWEETWSQNERIEEGVGASTGIRRYGYRQRELPGVSPGVIRFLLPITLFGNITDLGYELPPLYEDIKLLDMQPEQEGQYLSASKKILALALKIAKENHDPGGLSVWFNTVRFRPASAFRDETVHYESKKGPSFTLSLPQVISRATPWLPKELALADIVRENMTQKRRTLCFVEQSSTRDIRSRLKDVLLELVPNGKMTLCEIGILSASQMKPAKRELWIRQEVPKMHALLVNPKLVETGLDLVMFSDLVFYEITTSLYTLWQSMRRVWRLGQENDVLVTFLAYKNTMEEIILQRMGLKMKYAQLLYGENASGVLVETDTEDDIQREIIRDALKGKTFASIGEKINIFGTGKEHTTRITRAPEGSLIAASPTITIVELPEGDTMQLTLFPGFEPLPTIKRKRGNKPPSKEQLVFWSLPIGG